MVKNPASSKSIDESAVVMDKIPKIVFSAHGRVWTGRNARSANRNIEEAVSELKRQPGMNKI